MEAPSMVSNKKAKLYIGIPKETSFQENRVPLIPDSVALLTNHGHEIVIEAGAGAASKIEDSDFSEAGAKIAYSAEEVYKADIILKVAPPSKEEVQLLQNKQDNSFLFWIGSLAIYLGFIGRIIHYPYANYLLITGIILSAISFIYDPFKSSNKNDDLIDQDETF